MDSMNPQKPVRIVHLCYPGGSAQLIRDGLALHPHINLAQVAARSDIRRMHPEAICIRRTIGDAMFEPNGVKSTQTLDIVREPPHEE